MPITSKLQLLPLFLRRQAPNRKVPTDIAFKHCRQSLRKMHLPVPVWPFCQIPNKAVSMVSWNKSQLQPICLSFWNKFTMLWTRSHAASTLIIQRLLTRYPIWKFWKNSANSALGAAFLRWSLINLINVSNLFVWIIQARNFWMLQATCDGTSYVLHFYKWSAGCFEIQWFTSVGGWLKNFVPKE